MAIEVPLSNRQYLTKDLSYDNFKPREYETLETWLDSHDRISPFIQIIHGNQIPARRQSTHNRTITDLESFYLTLETYGEQLQNELDASMQSDELSNFPSFMKNIKYRKMTYLQDKIVDLKSKLISHNIYLIMERQADIKSLTYLLNSKLVDEDTTIAVSPSFFSININSTDTHITYLSEYGNRMLNSCDFASKPLWFSNFTLYFMQTLKKAIPRVCKKLFYIAYMEEEETLSICFSQLYSNEIMQLSNSSPENRPDALFNFCQSIIPNKAHLSQQEKAVSLLIIFRVIFELVSTEKTLKSDTSKEIIEKVIQITNLPIKCFTLPSTITSDDPNENVREFFMKHPVLGRAGDDISQCIFTSNPIDSLFAFHNALTKIDKIARDHGNGIQAACFDDMFSLFLGSFLASDATDIFFASKTMNQYLAKFILCPPFEYAMATVEALVIHLNNIDIEKIEQQTND